MVHTIALLMAYAMIFVLVAMLCQIIILSIKEKFFYKKDTYNDDVKSFIKEANKKKVRFVSLDFDSFKPLFELAPDVWIFKFPEFYYTASYVYLFHKENGSAPGSYIIFEKYKDYKKVEKLFKDYKSMQQARKESQMAIENFDSFKRLIQSDIDAKKQIAEKELEEANQFLNNLNKKE